MINVVQCTTERGANGMAFSIRMNNQEESLVKSYAKLHGMSVGEAFKKALFSQIEDEYDLAVAEDA